MLIAALVVHVACAVVLWRRAAKARTTRYVVKRNLASTFSSRMMRWGGVTILLFLVWHLLNFTIGKVNVAGRPDRRPLRPAGRLLRGLVAHAHLPASPWSRSAMHLRHGVWSAAQTLGLTNNARARRNANVLGVLLAVVIAGGFSLVPIFILFGVIS